MAEVISTAIDFLKLIRAEKELLVQFEKKDGSERLMKCTLDFDKIPKDKKPKGIDLPKILSKIYKSKILSVFDLEKQDWRSVPFDKIELITTPSKKIYKIKI